MGMQLGFGLRGKRGGSGLPSFATNSAPDMTLTGSTVTYAPGTYTPTPTGVLTTFYLNDIAQAPGAIVFPYTLAPGSNLRSTELPSSVGYAGSVVASDVVFNPMVTDLGAGDWITNEATADVDTRKTFVRATVAPQAGKEWRAYRGPNALGDLGALALLTLNGANYEWTSGGLAALGAIVYVRIAETDTGGANPRWASEVKSFVASNIPVTPTGLTVSQGATLGAIDALFAVAGDGRGRTISGPFARINGGAYFALSPSGNATGLRTFTAIGAEPVSIDVIWRNANGDSAAVNFPAVAPGIAAGPSMTMTFSTVASFPTGETRTFDVPVWWGNYAGDGSIRVRSDRAFNIIAATPVSAVLNGNVAYGIEKDVFKPLGLDGEQGWDQLVGVGATGDAAVRIPWNAARNLHPSIAGPQAVAIGEQSCYSQLIRLTTPLSHQVPEKFLYMFTGPVDPKADELRPPTMGGDTGSIVAMNAVNVAILPNLPTYAGAPTQAVALDANRAEAMFAWGGEAKQRINMQQIGPAASNYGAYYSRDRAETHARLLMDVPDADKLALLPACLLRAIDLVGLMRNGDRHGDGAGQFAGTVNDLLIAYCVTGKIDFLNAVYFLKSGITTRMRPITLPMVDQGLAKFPTSPGTKSRYQQAYHPSHVGLPMLITDAGDDASPLARYRGTMAPVVCAEHIILRNLIAPDGRRGWELLRDATGLYSANIACASDYADICFSEKNNAGQNIAGQSGISAAVRACWPIWNPLCGRATPTYIPPSTMEKTWVGNTADVTNQALTLMQPGAGTSLTFDYSEFSGPEIYSILPKTTVLYRFSIDDCQFFITDAGLNYNPNFTQVAPGVNMMPGLLHAGGVRFVSAAGPAPTWTALYRYEETVDVHDPRMKASPLGTPPAGIPTFAIAPELKYDAMPIWGGTDFQVLPATLPDTVGEIWCGTGYPANGLPTGYEYQVQRNTAASETPTPVIIGGAITKSYRPLSADEGNYLRMQTRANSAAGFSAWASTPWIYVPPAPALNPTVWIDTDFGVDFARRHPQILATAIAVGGTLTHDPYQNFAPEVLDGQEYLGVLTTTGWFGTKKTTSNPSCNYNLFADRPGETGNWRVTFDVPINWVASGGNFTWNSNGAYRLSRTNAATPAGVDEIIPLQTIVRPTVVDAEWVNRYTHDFNIPVGYPNLGLLFLRVSKSTASGGSVGGTPGLSKLRLERI